MLDSSQLLSTQFAAAIAAVLFLAALVVLFRQRRGTKARSTWSATVGDILVSEAKLPATHTSDDQPDVTTTIRYRYHVGSQSFESDVVNSGNRTGMNRAHAEALAARYPVGTKVDVHYDPRNPKDAMLEPAASDGLVAQSAITFVLGVAALALSVHAIAGKVIYTASGVPLFAFALPTVAFAASVAGIIAFLESRRKAQAADLWPTVNGSVTTSTVVEEAIETKDNDDDNAVRVTKRYRADVRYEYRVGERDYIGTNALGDWTPIYGVRDQAEKATAAYPTGKSVVVHYNPMQPRTAMLDPGDRRGSTAPLLFSALCGVVGAVLLAFLLTVRFEI